MKIYTHYLIGNNFGILIVYIVLTLLAILAILPIYWMYLSSFKVGEALFSINWLPQSVSWLNWNKLFEENSAWAWFWNSILVTLVCTFITVFTSALSGYAFSKLKFPGREILFWISLSTVMIPSQVTIVPLFIIATNAHLIDTYFGIMFPTLISMFGMFLMKQFIHTLPGELIEAGRIDGCSEVRIFSQIILPLSIPGLIVLGIFTLMGNWNNFLWPLIIVNTDSMWTLPVGLSVLADPNFEFDMGVLLAGASFAATPMIILFFVLQKYFLTGLTIGAVKG